MSSPQSFGVTLVGTGGGGRSSTLDPSGRAHRVDALHVLDASSGAVKPSLTVMANSPRVGRHRLARTG